MSSASVDVCGFLELILEFIHMYARCGHAGTWRARTQRLAETTPWREKNGDATFAGFKFGSYRKKSCRLSQDVFVADHHMVSSQGRYMSSHGVIARKIYLYVNVLYYLLCVNFLYVRCAGVNLAKQMLLA